MTANWTVGIDIGGTFTDIVAVSHGDNSVRTAKVPTTTSDRVAGLEAAFNAVGLQWSDIADLIHGTTMVTNAIVEDELAEVALISTEGFSDTLAIGRQNRIHLYRLDLPPKARPQVPAQNRFEVVERLDHNGLVLKPLDLDSVVAVIERIAASGVQAVAVSLLHSYVDSCHEEQLSKLLRDRFPFVALSNQVNPEAREYERSATTVLSASVMPLVAGYLHQLEEVRPKESRLHLFHSAGGMATPAALRELPLTLALSGPAAGVVAAGRIARELKLDHAISFDMGGTTTDVCLIVGGQAQISSDRSLGGRPLRQPMVAVESIGAGGGSIARFDHGSLRVGPESAGADPGPACYCRGGKLPTVSDANLILGYMDSERIVGGNMTLDVTAARVALAPLAAQMSMSIEAAALGIVKVVNSAMVMALRRVTVERGIDGRQCVLLAYGGAGPMHAVDVARAFGIAKVIVPNHSSVFSALGCVSAEMSYAQQRTVRMAVGEWDVGRLKAVRDSLSSRLSAPLLAAGYVSGNISIEEVAAVRYRGQSYAIEIAKPCFEEPQQLGKAFSEQHLKLYGFVADDPWELVAIRQRASVPRSSKAFRSTITENTRATPIKTGECTFDLDITTETARYSRSRLCAGQRLAGPVIVEDEWSTVAVPTGATLISDEHGHLHIETGAKQ